MLYIGKMSGWLSDKCCFVVQNTEAKAYRYSVLIGFLPSLAGAKRLCTVYTDGSCKGHAVPAAPLRTLLSTPAAGIEHLNSKPYVMAQ